ncbi:unnamed protein product [Echinostoma caproni]|uniref:Secreted protein n=1 Tax=Echinostoma caproni TaxID=27848 RepID=A0A183A5S1_9TREM|nr:unnamed protein product [Echinostoma caproni]
MNLWPAFVFRHVRVLRRSKLPSRLVPISCTSGPKLPRDDDDDDDDDDRGDDYDDDYDDPMLSGIRMRMQSNGHASKYASG